MYLTQIDLNLANRLTRADVSDAYEMHSTLARLMSSDPQIPPKSYLWRLEQQGANGFRVLLQSVDRPKPEHMVGDRADWALFVKTKEFDLAALIAAGTHFRFRLRANPSVCRNGKRHGLVREPEQLEWLARQGQKGGFVAESVLVSQAARLIGGRRKGGGDVVVFSVLFDGVLRVTDLPRLEQVVSSGLGRAKHMGLGLLSLSPLKK